MKSHHGGLYSGPHCFSCGRPFDLDHRRAGDGNIIKYCSKGCRSKKYEKDKKLEEALLEMIKERAPKSICPSYFARSYFSEADWREKMELIRCAGRRLALRSIIRITQKDRPVASLNFKGPVRFSLLDDQ